jgi:hypothetical protein
LKLDEAEAVLQLHLGVLDQRLRGSAANNNGPHISDPEVYERMVLWTYRGLEDGACCGKEADSHEYSPAKK